MTGGGRARRGGMGTKVTAGLVSESQPDNTPQMKKSIEELERRVANLVPSIAASERKEQTITQKVYQLEEEHRRLSMDIQVSVPINVVICNVANNYCFTASDKKCACLGKQA